MKKKGGTYRVPGIVRREVERERKKNPVEKRNPTGVPIVARGVSLCDLVPFSSVLAKQIPSTEPIDTAAHSAPDTNTTNQSPTTQNDRRPQALAPPSRARGIRRPRIHAPDRRHGRRTGGGGCRQDTRRLLPSPRVHGDRCPHEGRPPAQGRSPVRQRRPPGRRGGDHRGGHPPTGPPRVARGQPRRIPRPGGPLPHPHPGHDLREAKGHDPVRCLQPGVRPGDADRRRDRALQVLLRPRHVLRGRVAPRRVPRPRTPAPAPGHRLPDRSLCRGWPPGVAGRQGRRCRGRLEVYRVGTQLPSRVVVRTHYCPPRHDRTTLQYTIYKPHPF
mmetsp:Transcript_6253/g.14759  ORF Transcript_6253/g.14759 Transcript_6253/m.14759 type:complete len:330 (+) Transcript_6253:72-1061(+)